jgi:choline dehydrogenase-like flavoprotein
MLVDTSELVDGAAIEADICIVGAGLAGIALATRLDRVGVSIALIESGPIGPSAEADDLSVGAATLHPYFDFIEAAPRRFGGAAEMWGAWCRPLDTLDLEDRPWPDSGWPIPLAEMEAYFTEGCEFLRLSDCGFGGEAWTDALPPLYRHIQRETSLEIGVWQESPLAPISETYADPLAASETIAVYLGATALDIQVDGDETTVTGIKVGTANGKRFTVSAGHFVLAGGALGTVRLLLSSTNRFKSGVGNEHGLVGRYFAEHPHIVGGRIPLKYGRGVGRPRFAAIDRGILGTMARIEMERPRAGIRAGIHLSEDLRRREELPNVIAHLRPPSVEPPRSALVFFREVRHRDVKKALKALPSLFRNIPEVVNVVYRRLLKRPAELELYVQVETTPNPDSRIVLSDEKDAFGMPRAEMQWRITDFDKQKLRRTIELMGEELEAIGLGTLRLEPWVKDPGEFWSSEPFGGLHLMGTTRMSESPERGVVDTDGRVHGLANLWVAGSSVFPTYGAANPGLTIAATALRTADRIAKVTANI